MSCSDYLNTYIGTIRTSRSDYPDKSFRLSECHTGVRIHFDINAAFSIKKQIFLEVTLFIRSFSLTEEKKEPKETATPNPYIGALI